MTARLYRFIPVLVIGLAVALIGQQTPAHAATTSSQAITLSPASTDIAIDPGASAAKSLDIINSGSDSFNVTLSASPYHVTGENYDASFTQLPGTVDASAWVKLSTKSGVVGADKVLTIPYSINIPKNTAPGGYYAVVFAETSTDNEKTGVVSHNRVGNILYITVNGSIKSGGKVTGETLPFLHFTGDLPIGIKVSNSGGTHFISKATYSVTDYSGNTVFTATTERYVLPATEREFSATWTPRSLFGIYTIHRNATIAGKVQSLPDKKVVVINPWFLLAVVFLLGILIGVPYQRARQRRVSQRK